MELLSNAQLQELALVTKGKLEIQQMLLSEIMALLASEPGPRAVLVRAISRISTHLKKADQNDRSVLLEVNERAREQMLADLNSYAKFLAALGE